MCASIREKVTSKCALYKFGIINFKALLTLSKISRCCLASSSAMHFMLQHILWLGLLQEKNKAAINAQYACDLYLSLVSSLTNAR